MGNRFIAATLVGAAALVSTTVIGHAADLPSRKAAPVAYVKICDVYGRGFYYIPGTNTCLKVGGRVRFELFYHRAQNAWVQNGVSQAGLAAAVNTANVGAVSANVGAAGIAAFSGGAFNSAARQDTLGWRGRAYVNMDARTQTAWGTVQTVFSFTIRTRSGLSNASSRFTPGGSTNSSVNLYAAYIRFAGFTFGRAPWVLPTGAGKTYSSYHVGGDSIGMLQLTYTAVFGGGFSATAGIVDINDFGRNTNAGDGFTNGFRDAAGVSRFGNAVTGVLPNRLPMAVLALRVDQGWGMAAIGGAVARHQAVAGNRPNRKYSTTGWAVTGTVQIKLPMLAKGDFVQFYAGYADGLLDAVSRSEANGSGDDGRRMGGYFPRINNYNIFVCGASAALVATACIQNNKLLVATAEFYHFWTPTLRSGFIASYAKFTPGSAATNNDWFILGGKPVSTNWQLGTNLIWYPTKGFELGLELFYQKTNNKLACGTGGAVVPGYVCSTWGSVASGTNGVAQNPSDFMVKFRAQRTF